MTPRDGDDLVGKMNCDRCCRAIERFVAGELDEHEAEAVDAHIETCPDCARQVDLSMSMDRRLEEAFVMATPAGEAPSIGQLAERALAEGRRRRRRFIAVLSGASAAAVLLVAVLLSGLGGGGEPSGPTVDVAIRDGLQWLASSQSAQGYWESDRPQRFRVGLTGLAVLALVTSDQAATDAALSVARDRGIEYLQSLQRPDGCIDAPGEGATHYGHAIATLALAEALGREVPSVERRSVQRAVEFCLRSQLPQGSWSYAPGEQARLVGDTSHTGWFVLALLRAERAGIEIDPRTLVRARRWIETMTDDRGTVGYQVTGFGTPATTAIGMMVNHHVDDDPAEMHTPPADAACRMLGKPEDQKTLYFWHFLVRAGKPSCPEHPQWTRQLSQQLVSSQVRDRGEMTGSWNRQDTDAAAAGRVYATAMAVMTLDGLRESN